MLVGRLGDLGRLLPADQDRARRVRPGDDRVRARALAALLLYVVIAARGDGPRARSRFAAPAPGRVLIQGLLSVALPFMLISFGETQISSGLTGVLISPGPLFVALLAPVARPAASGSTAAGAIGLLIGFAGVVLLIGVDTVHDLGEFLGALAMLGAASQLRARRDVREAALRAPACRRSWSASLLRRGGRR